MIDASNHSIEPSGERLSGPGPLGLGLFLASAVVLFAGILTGYVLLRVNDPGAFSWAPSLLDRRLGLVSAAALVATCLAATGALTLALLAKPAWARGLFTVALLAGGVVVAVRAIELPETSRRAGFLFKRAVVATRSVQNQPVAAPTHVGDAANGKRIFLGTCAACHAPDGSGVKGQGQNLRSGTFLKDRSDEQALAFVKKGRQPFDPDSKLHLAMPARGGNPSLSDASLLDAIAYARGLEGQAVAVPAAAAAASSAASPATRAPSSDQPQVIDGELWLPHSILPGAQVGPTGSVAATVALQRVGAEGRTPSNVRRFFSILLFVNGLHTIYVLIGVGLGVWLLVATARGRTAGIPLAMAAAYWIIIGSIGAVLIPAFYL